MPATGSCRVARLDHKGGQEMIRLRHTWKILGMLCVRTTVVFLLIAGGGLQRWATAQTPAVGSGGNALIGKLEGPEVIVDPTQFPKTFKEAPQLAELVKAGKLPPVAERIGQDPLVIKPLHEVGRYGGTWRGGFTGPAHFWNGFRCCSGPDHPMVWDYHGHEGQ